jgi:protein Mpv17
MSYRRRRCLALAITTFNTDAISGTSAFCPKFREYPSSRSPKQAQIDNNNSIASASRLHVFGASDNDDTGGGPVPKFPLVVLSSVSSRLLGWLERKPLSANAISAGVIALLGDILAQLIEGSVRTATAMGGKRLNVLRMASFAVSGMVFVGPYLHIFYGWLWAIGAHLQNRYNISRRQQLILQVTLDQTLGIVLFYPAYYYVFEYSEAILGLKALGPVAQRATSKMMQGGNLVSVFLANWAVWIPAQWITFAFVPERLRVIVSNIVSVFWNCYLCTKVA